MQSKAEHVLVDTSVWISAFRGKSSKIVDLTRKLLDEDRIVICGPVILELRRGLRSRDRNRVLPLFDALIRLSFDENLWDSAGDLDASLRRKGITIPPMDILIAQVCLHHKVPLFTLDEHFRYVPGIKLFTAHE